MWECPVCIQIYRYRYTIILHISPSSNAFVHFVPTRPWFKQSQTCTKQLIMAINRYRGKRKTENVDMCCMTLGWMGCESGRTEITWGPDLLIWRICGYYKDSFPVCFMISFHFHWQNFFSKHVVFQNNPESVCLPNCLLFIVTKYCMEVPIQNQWNSFECFQYIIWPKMSFILFYRLMNLLPCQFSFLCFCFTGCVTSAHAKLMQNWLLINSFLAARRCFMSSLWQTADGKALREPQRAQRRPFPQSN